MLTAILKRNVDSDELQLTQHNLLKEMWSIPGAEMLVENTWAEGIKKTRTPYLVLLEGDCLLSHGYLEDLFSVLEEDGTKRGGYRKLVMVSPAFANKQSTLYGYTYTGHKVLPNYEAYGYFQHAQIGFVPGALIRTASVKGEDLPWDEPDLVKMSTLISFHLWNTNRRVGVNPLVHYVTTFKKLEKPFTCEIPERVQQIYDKERL